MTHGKITLDGPSKTVCNAFYDVSDKRIHEVKQNNAASGRTESSGDIEILTARMLNKDNQPAELIEHQQDVIFEVVYQVHRELPNPVFGVGIHTTDFLYLATSQSIEKLQPGILLPGSYTLRYEVRHFPFLPGIYSLRLGVALADTFQSVFYSENVLSIQVSSHKINRALVSAGQEGFITLDGEWSLTQQESHNQKIIEQPS